MKTKGQDKPASELIEWALKRRDRVLIVSDEKEVDRVNDNHNTLKNRNQVMTLRTYMKLSPALPRVTKVAIVQAETVLRNYVRHGIHQMGLHTYE